MKNELLVKALGKLDEEMQNSDCEYIRYIHEHTEPLLYEADENVLREIAEGKKTLAGALDGITAEAMKRAEKKPMKKMNGISYKPGWVGPDDGLKISDEYFGLGKTKEKPAAVTASIFDLI